MDLLPEDEDLPYDVQQEIARQRADGALLSQKAGLLLESFSLPRLYTHLQDQDLSLPGILEISKFLKSLWEVEVKKKQAQVASGPAMSITINLPGSAPGDAQIINITPADPEIPGTPPTLSNNPTFNNLKFAFNSDLALPDDYE